MKMLNEVRRVFVIDDPRGVKGRLKIAETPKEKSTLCIGGEVVGSKSTRQQRRIPANARAFTE